MDSPPDRTLDSKFRLRRIKSSSSGRPMMTPRQLADVRDAMQRALADSDTDDRAELLELVNRQIMDHVKLRDPGGEGLDGADGPERQDLNPVINAVLEYADQHRARKFGLSL